MKGNEKTIGVILAVIVGILAGILGLKNSDLKAGFCGTEAPISVPVASTPEPIKE